MVGTEISSYDDAFKMNAQNESSITINQHLDTLIKITNTEINHWIKYGGSVNILHIIKKMKK